jgi:hypothetical protein
LQQRLSGIQISRNCFGFATLLWGQNREPIPPAMIAT